MNKRYKYLVLMVTLVILLIPGTAFARDLQDDRVVAGGTFTLESGETLDGSLIVFGGTAAIEQGSLVEGDAVVFGGIVTIDGTVDGNVVGVGGVVNLKENAIVEGDLTTVAATLNRDPGAQVDGQVITEFDFSPALTVFPETLDFPKTFTNFEPVFNPVGFTLWRVIWFIFRTLLWGALAALVAMFLPKPTTRTTQAIVNQPVMAGGVGLLTIIVTPIILLLLAITCILSPISLLGVLALVVAWVFGRIAIGLEIGNRIAKTFDRDWPVPLAAGVGTFGLALVVDSLGTFIPCVGWLIPTLVGLFGLGGVVLTRFGTQSYPVEDEVIDGEEAPFPAELIEPEETQALEDKGEQADSSEDLPDPAGDGE
jgi:cytoskeletal protein CcmA (bactofilin family)